MSTYPDFSHGRIHHTTSDLTTARDGNDFCCALMTVRPSPSLLRLWLGLTLSHTHSRRSTCSSVSPWTLAFVPLCLVCANDFSGAECLPKFLPLQASVHKAAQTEQDWQLGQPLGGRGKNHMYTHTRAHTHTHTHTSTMQSHFCPCHAYASVTLSIDETYNGNSTVTPLLSHSEQTFMSPTAVMGQVLWLTGSKCCSGMWDGSWACSKRQERGTNKRDNWGSWEKLKLREKQQEGFSLIKISQKIYNMVNAVLSQYILRCTMNSRDFWSFSDTWKVSLARAVKMLK